MHKSRLGNIVIDCKTEDLLSQAQFWSNALGYPLPQDIDVTNKFIQLITPPGEVQVIIQRVGHEARAHLDIETDSIELEIARMERLGAVVVSRNDSWVVMQAPSGHRFCVGSPYRDGFDQGAKHVGVMPNNSVQRVQPGERGRELRTPLYFPLVMTATFWGRR